MPLPGLRCTFRNHRNVAHHHRRLTRLPVRLVGRHSNVICSSPGGIRARWCIDIRYGVKSEAVALLQEWVRDIGSQAGVTPFNAQISSGAVGVPESRLELEVSFDNLVELEEFWGAIPVEAHKAWSQRAQHVIIDGSPVWNVFRTCALLPPSPQDGAATKSTPVPTFDLERPRPRPRMRLASDAAKPAVQLSNAAEKEASAAQPQAESTEDTEYDGPVDWKGDPMHINPGDKGLGMFM